MVYVFLTVWKVMEMCYKILGEGKLVTQRELFYKLLSDSPKYFSCQRHVNQSIQGLQHSNILHVVLVSSLCNPIIGLSLCSCADVVSLLRCTRQSLGIMASSRGALIGRLVLHVCVCSKYVLPDRDMCSLLRASIKSLVISS
jgi:meiotic recombination protein SPO11